MLYLRYIYKCICPSFLTSGQVQTFPREFYSKVSIRYFIINGFTFLFTLKYTEMFSGPSVFYNSTYFSMKDFIIEYKLIRFYQRDVIYQDFQYIYCIKEISITWLLKRKYLHQLLFNVFDEQLVRSSPLLDIMSYTNVVR